MQQLECKVRCSIMRVCCGYGDFFSKAELALNIPKRSRSGFAGIRRSDWWFISTTEALASGGSRAKS
jgi:hypothetical protein